MLKVDVLAGISSCIVYMQECIGRKTTRKCKRRTPFKPHIHIALPSRIGGTSSFCVRLPDTQKTTQREFKYLELG